MSILYTLTSLAETVGHWRFQGNVQSIARNHYEYTLPTLDETVGHWRFKGNTIDISGNSNNFTETGIDSGNYSIGYTENGTTAIIVNSPDLLSIASGSAADFNMGTSDFTIEMIVKIPKNTSATSILDKKAGAAGRGWRCIILPPVWRMEIRDNTNQSNIDTNSSSTLADGLFHYVVWVVDRFDNTGSVYVDAILQDVVYNISAITGDITNISEDFQVQGLAATNIELDEICITKRVLTAAEISSRHNGRVIAATTPVNHFTVSGIDSDDYSTGYTEKGTTAIEVLTSNSLTIAASNAIDFNMGPTDFTVEMIFNVPVDAGANTLIQKTAGTAPGWGAQIAGTGSSKFSFAISGSFGGISITSSLSDIDDSTWHYVAAVVDRTNDEVKVYIDGVQDGSTTDISTVSGNIDSPQPLYMQHLVADIKIDELCITKRALTASEIAIRAVSHGDPLSFTYETSPDVTTNVVTTTLNAFDIQLKHVCDHVLSSGTFTLLTCPRCLGTGFYYDIKFDADGHPPQLSIEDKLAQSLEKMVLTSENKFHEDLVVGVQGRLGELTDDVEGIIRYDLIQAVATLQENQRNVSNLSSRAQIARLDKVTVVQESAGSLRYLIEITAVSGEQIELSGTVHISGQ